VDGSLWAEDADADSDNLEVEVADVDKVDSRRMVRRDQTEASLGGDLGRNMEADHGHILASGRTRHHARLGHIHLFPDLLLAMLAPYCQRGQSSLLDSLADCPSHRV
jgi:hypothetical protein